ncbi:MAG: hypothetical protein JJE12_11885, partial [Anaerolineales bacterium]|nr:hypothetical protein [Anaerolineales bacterium]
MNSNQDAAQKSAWSPSILRMSAGLLLLLILIVGGLSWLWPQANLLLRIIFVPVVGGVILYVIRQVFQLQGELSSIRAQVVVAENESARIIRRSEASMQLSQKFVEANDENEVLNSLLPVMVGMVGAVGASVVPLDERGQPLAAISHGEIPKSLMDSWVEYLASPEVRHKCASCQQTGSL